MPILAALPLAALPLTTGARPAAESALKVFDCRLGTEIGSVVPHERVVWIAQGETLAGALPKDVSDPGTPNVVTLDFGTALGATMTVNCDNLAKIAAVDTDGDRVHIKLRGEVRWRIDRREHALVVWNPRQVFSALSRTWPSSAARQILVEARAMGVAPEQADDLEARLDFERHRSLGLRALGDGRWAEAAAQLEQAFGFVPNDIEIGIELARARYKLAHYDAAEELLESLVGIAPQSAEVRHELGLLTLSDKRHEEALDHFRAAASHGGVNAYFYLGFLAFQSGDDASAERDLAHFLVRRTDGPLATRARTMLDVIARRVAAAEAASTTESVTPSVPAAAPPSATSVHLPSLGDTRLTLEGVNVPDIGLRDLDGRPAIVHLWATWCPPCRVEMPSIRRFVRDRLPSMGARGPAMITVSMDYTREELVGSLDAWGEDEPGALPPVYWDPNWRLALGLELGTALPQTLLVDRHGQVVAAYVGAHDWQDGPLVRAIEALVDGD